jgi:wyosine [tRNA(Phe)-imidazoG37] synthetase (radical SAM superfamily)
LHWVNFGFLSISNIEQLLKFLDVDLTSKKITLCGNYGDPIYHPDLVNFVDQLKKRGAQVSIITNGSYKKHEWWEQLAETLDSNDSVTFSVDGTPENFTQYRVNADWKSIQTGMTVMAGAACETVWKYIPFSFNQDTIDQAQELSTRLGITKFKVEFSDRFTEKTQYLKPSDQYVGSRLIPQTQWKNNKQILEIDAKCKQGNYHYISADGHYSPCCFLNDHRFYYKNQFGKNKNSYNITKTTLSDILQRPVVVDFFKDLSQQPGCQYNCPKLG